MLQGVRQRQLQDALQIRARGEALHGVRSPDRPLAPAAQPPEPARLRSGLTGLLRMPETLTARAAGPAPGRDARSACVPRRHDDQTSVTSFGSSGRAVSPVNASQRAIVAAT